MTKPTWWWHTEAATRGGPVNELLLIFMVSFLTVCVKVVQGRNFAFDNYLMVMPTSIVMAMLDLYIYASIAKVGWELKWVLAIGIGSGLGAMCGMYVHGRWIKKEKSA